MFKIDNKVYNDETVELKIANVYVKKEKIKVIDLKISYVDNNIVNNHLFESIERLDYLEKLPIGNEIERHGISDYLRFENNDLEEKGMDINYKVDTILPDEDIIIKCKRIDTNKIIVNIIIKKLNIYCDETINILLNKKEVQ